MTDLNDRLEYQQRSNDHRCTQAYLLFGTSLLLVITLGFAAQAMHFLLGLAFTLIGLILIPAVVYIRSKNLPITDALRIRKIDGTIGILSVLVGVSGWAIAMVIHYFTNELLGFRQNPTSNQNAFSVPYLSGLLLVMAVLPGICEEILFRGVIQGTVERRGKLFAVVVTGVLFGIFHLSPSVIPAATFLGLTFGWLVVRTGSLIPAMIAHASNNATAIAVPYFFGDTLVEFKWLVLVLGVTFSLCVYLVWRLTRNANPLPSPLLYASATVHGRKSWLLVPAGMVAALVVFFALAFSMSFRIEKVRFDFPESNLGQGKWALVALDRSRARKLSVGEIVLVETETSAELRKILRQESESIFVWDGNNETQIRRNQILGKVVYPRAKQ